MGHGLREHLWRTRIKRDDGGVFQRQVVGFVRLKAWKT